MLFILLFCFRWIRRTFTGAWIEISKMIKHLKRSAVAPSQVRGLKLISSGSIPCFKSRTFTGAWIEIVMTAYLVLLAFVAPSQVRGLKY